MDYIAPGTVTPELSLPGLNDSFKTSILEDENKRLRQSLRRSRSVLGTPVTSICVAGAGFGLRATGPAGNSVEDFDSSRSRRASRNGTPGSLHTLRTDKKKNLGRAWRSKGFEEEGKEGFRERPRFYLRKHFAQSIS